jgi:ABC-type amino acid transport system permease subunit
MVERWKINATTIATITAVAAIVLGIIDSIQTRAHNRLSVAPYLVVDYTVNAQTGQSIFIVHLNNEGVGPAIIKSVRVKLPAALGGQEYAGWNDVAELLEARGAKVPTYWNFEGGEALGVQRGRELIRVVMPSAIAATLQPLLSQIDVEVRYTSIYKQEFEARLSE